MRKRYFWTCPKCGSSLDPGEHCDCDREDTAPVKIRKKGEENGKTVG